MINTDIKESIITRKDLISTIIEKIYEFKELGDQEFKSSKLQCDILKELGYDVKLGYSGLNTAFMAKKTGRDKKGVVAILSEYDALPKIGHGCGHNLISAMAIGAAIAMKTIIDELPLEIRIIGTPAEETTAGKIKMVEDGVFDDIDCVIMCHPYNSTGVHVSSLAIQGIEYRFIGQTSHSANAPEEGRNALQAMINFFNNINGLRLHLPATSSIHGIITYGGEAPNIIPDLSISKFNIRESNVKKLDKLLDIVGKAAEAAALSTGTHYETNNYLKTIYDVKTNNILADVMKEKLYEEGFTDVINTPLNLGSSDIGNVSYIVPTVHAMVNVTENYIPLHTMEFAENTLTDYALENVIKASAAMAKVVKHVGENIYLLKEMREEFERL